MRFYSLIKIAAMICLMCAVFLVRASVLSADDAQAPSSANGDPCAIDSDNDGLKDCEEDVNGNGKWDKELGETDPRNPDSDGDGLTDGEERLHTGKVAALLDAGKIQFKAVEKLDPNNPDSDDDCLPDGLELGVTADDANALISKMHVRPHLILTPRCKAILEKAGVQALENAIPYDETQKAGAGNIAMLYDMDPGTVTDPTSGDSDRDGLEDGEEDTNFNGRRDSAASSDASAAKAMGISIKAESVEVNAQNGGAPAAGPVVWLETDPNIADSDGDGLLDGEEGDRDHDGKLGPYESDPLKADTDGDGVPDGEERMRGTGASLCDSDEDGLSDGVELGKIQPIDNNGCHGLQAAGTNYKKPGIMNPLNPDSDGDGLKDGEEDKNGNGWVDPDETDPSLADTDGDGLNDYVETTGDFNGDGIPDFDVNSVPGEGNCRPPKSISDIDCDGIPNALDDDSDNDGCPDSQEGGWIDTNGNGIPDVYDKDAKLCQETGGESGSSGGGGSAAGSGGSTEKKPTATASTSENPFMRDGTDGGACSLLPDVMWNMRDSTAVPAILLFAVLVIMLVRGRTPCRS